MVGDYVKYLGRIKRIKQVGPDNEIRFFGNDNLIVSNDLIEPIQITPEFLEKNFEKKTFYGIFDDYFDLTIREYSDSLYIVDYHCCEMNLPDQQVTVCFVHELQHFFRLCGVEKEIQL